METASFKPQIVLSSLNHPSYLALQSTPSSLSGNDLVHQGSATGLGQFLAPQGHASELGNDLVLLGGGTRALVVQGATLIRECASASSGTSRSVTENKQHLCADTQGDHNRSGLRS